MFQKMRDSQEVLEVQVVLLVLDGHHSQHLVVQKVLMAQEAQL